MSPLLFQQLGTTEILLILAVVVLLFGAKKLPELARGSGQALRIFKAETKELKAKDTDEDTPEKGAVSADASEKAELSEADAQRRTEPDA